MFQIFPLIESGFGGSNPGRRRRGGGGGGGVSRAFPALMNQRFVRTRQFPVAVGDHYSTKLLI